MFPPQGAPSLPMAQPPSPAAAPQPPPPLEMAADDLAAWWKRITLARSARKKQSEKWRLLMRAYLPPDMPAGEINSNVHFRNIHLKMAELFGQFPDLQLTPLEPLDEITDPATGNPPTDPHTGQPMDPSALAAHVVAVKRALLQKLLGADGADVEQTITEALFDVCGISGIGPSEIAYEADVKQMPQEMPGPTTTMPGSVLGLQDVPGEPTTQMTPVVVNERILWDHFSPNAFLMPHDNHSTRWDDVPWLGREFQIPRTPGNLAQYQLPPDFRSPAVPSDELYVTDGRHRDETDGLANILRGVRIWLHARDFDPEMVDKDVFYQLVLIEGQKDKPAIYRASPHQDIGPDGKLSATSLIGNPIHPFSLRVATDVAWIPSDSAFTDPLVRQENTWLGITVKQRDANLPRFFHSDLITEAVDKLKQMDVGQGVAISEEAAGQGINRLIMEIPHLESAESDIQGHAIIRRAMEETLGTQNQATIPNTGRISATESAMVARNISVRLKGEQNKLLKTILTGTRKFDALVMRYLSPQYVRIAGRSGASLLVLLDRQMISGRYAYDAHPDTMVTIDADALQEKWLKFTNFMAKSAYLNQEENARNGALAFGYDPSKLIVTPPPPSPPVEHPRTSIALVAADLAIPEVQTLLKMEGLDLTTQPPSPQLLAAHAVATAPKNLPHGGVADRAPLLSEHISQHTGSQDGRPPVAPAPPTDAIPHGGLH